ncbi:AAA family ATPase [Paenibacillus sp. YYML68]|uniref:AAA family ATPase n=1 Tax=Paenibacillus sp. YYML68 TaxID=2909250 RepID=UPI0024926C7B|nr:ATP-binding protein [Paenibacillus sp. YYML68]
MSKSKTNSRLPRSKGIDMATFYAPKDCARKVRRIVLPPDNRQIIEEFITILSMKEKFEQYDVPIPNKMLMFGPPGTGKTLSAFYLATRLELPLIMVRLDAIIHSHLGETGSNIRKIFDYAKAEPCVLFLDEFDAIARTRETNDEVKEMARAVNTLLQCLDEFECDSTLIAATNLEGELDQAIWRRFDTKMTYSMPNDASRTEFIALLIGEFEQEEAVQLQTTELLKGCSFADIEQIVLKAKRKAIIESRPLCQSHIEEALREYNPQIARESNNRTPQEVMNS